MWVCFSSSNQVLPLVDVEMEAGDALFFHSNVLHRSDKNDSDRRRWAFLIAYNRASNNPVIPHHHPQYTKLDLVGLNLASLSWFLEGVAGGREGKIEERKRKSNQPPSLQVPDSAIMECPPTIDFTGKDFMNPDHDKS